MTATSSVRDHLSPPDAIHQIYRGRIVWNRVKHTRKRPKAQYQLALPIPVDAFFYDADYKTHESINSSIIIIPTSIPSYLSHPQILNCSKSTHSHQSTSNLPIHIITPPISLALPLLRRI